LVRRAPWFRASQPLVEPQTGSESGDFGLGLVAATFSKCLLEPGEALDGLFGGVGREFVARVLHVGVELIEAPRRQDVREPDRLHAEASGHGLLRQVANLSLVLDRASDAQMLGRVAEQHREQR
jgi:hypothetical protein